MPPDQDADRVRDLLLREPERRERADASRNRNKVLATARELVEAHGVAALSLNDLAKVAGVGVGTVYRRFGDRAGVIHALMVEHERTLSAAIESGPPPLGPGAPPAQRIRAFLHAYCEVVVAYADLMTAAEAAMTPRRRYGTGAYADHHRHLVDLLHELDGDLDAEYLADAFLAPLSAALIAYQHDTRGMSLARLKRGLDALLAHAVASTEQHSRHKP